MNCQHKLCLDDTYHFHHLLFFCFTGLRNGVVVDIYWKIWSLLVLKLWQEDLLYASYAWKDTEKQIVRQLCVERYRETNCMPVMRRKIQRNK